MRFVSFVSYRTCREILQVSLFIRLSIHLIFVIRSSLHIKSRKANIYVNVHVSMLADDHDNPNQFEKRGVEGRHGKVRWWCCPLPICGHCERHWFRIELFPCLVYCYSIIQHVHRSDDSNHSASARERQRTRRRSRSRKKKERMFRLEMLRLIVKCTCTIILPIFETLSYL